MSKAAKAKRLPVVNRIRMDEGPTSPAIRVLMYDNRQSAPVRIKAVRTTRGYRGTGYERVVAKIDLSYEEAIRLADALMEAVIIHKDDAYADANPESVVGED